MFDFFLNTRIKFGVGVRSSLKEVLLKEGWKNAGIIVDHNILDLLIVAEFIADLKKSLKSLVIGKCTISEPTYLSLEEIRREFCHPSLQVIIGLGGGSALDMAKAMAVFVHNKKPAIEYRGFDKMTEPVLPIIAIPTTAGTGSEITPNASFIDTQEKKKLGINGEEVRPRHAFLDPELTLSCPKTPTISAGVDSMVHAVEAFAAKKTNRIARLFAKEGFQRVFNALPVLVDDLNNSNLREEVMYGAFLSGIALMHSGTGPSAAMSYPLSVHYHVPHGLGGGIFLPYVIEHNIKAGYKNYSMLYNPDNFETNHAQTTFLDKIHETWNKINIPNELQIYGITKEDIPTIVDETMQLKGALDQNPVPFYEAEIDKTLKLLIGSK